jgi:uncharacterized membrane protein
MIVEAEKLRIATTTGLIHWTLIVHAAAGITGLVTGFVALIAAKGSRVHKAAGRLFVGAMLVMALLAAGIAVYAGRPLFLGGLFVAYLILTAMAAVRPLPFMTRGLAITLGIFSLAYGVVTIRSGVEVMHTPTGSQNGTPFGMLFFLGTIALLAGVGDLRMVRTGGLHGSRRIARHLWRMCFGLFVASGSFFLGQIRFFPEWMRRPALLIVPSVLPLVALLYWLWRVRGAQAKNRLRFVSVM